MKWECELVPTRPAGVRVSNVPGRWQIWAVASHLLAQWGLLLCCRPRRSPSLFSVGDSLLDRNFLPQGSGLQTSLAREGKIGKMSPADSLYSGKIAADKSILLPWNSWRKSNPFVKPTRSGWADCQDFPYVLEMGKSSKRDKEQLVFMQAPGIRRRGRVQSGFWVPFVK